MPRRFSAEECAAAESVAAESSGALRLEQSFEGNKEAWHQYQDVTYFTLTLGESLPAVGDDSRAKRWKAARRQFGQVLGQRVRDRQEAERAERSNVDTQQVLRERNADCPRVILRSGRAPSGSFTLL